MITGIIVVIIGMWMMPFVGKVMVEQRLSSLREALASDAEMSLKFARIGSALHFWGLPAALAGAAMILTDLVRFVVLLFAKKRGEHI